MALGPYPSPGSRGGIPAGLVDIRRMRRTARGYVELDKPIHAEAPQLSLPRSGRCWLNRQPAGNAAGSRHCLMSRDGFSPNEVFLPAVKEALLFLKKEQLQRIYCRWPK